MVVPLLLQPARCPGGDRCPLRERLRELGVRRDRAARPGLCGLPRAALRQRSAPGSAPPVPQPSVLCAPGQNKGLSPGAATLFCRVRESSGVEETTLRSSSPTVSHNPP